ncbi:MAG: MGH1-like glycoside hydrolase domain-containing protein, partial [Balneolaceae bacterium]
FAEIPNPEQAQEIVHAHLIPFDLENFYLMPSTPYYSEKFDPKRYWRGPVWINMNWMFMQGLQSYGYEFWADLVKQDTFELIEQFGIYEYYHPKKSDTEGCGSSHFSWTAALFLDLLHRS